MGKYIKKKISYLYKRSWPCITYNDIWCKSWHSCYTIITKSIDLQPESFLLPAYRFILFKLRVLVILFAGNISFYSADDFINIYLTFNQLVTLFKSFRILRNVTMGSVSDIICSGVNVTFWIPPLISWKAVHCIFEWQRVVLSHG